MTQEEITKTCEGCTAIVSCLGHNLTMEGMFSSSTKHLVVSTTTKLFQASSSSSSSSSSDVDVVDDDDDDDEEEEEKEEDRAFLEGHFRPHRWRPTTGRAKRQEKGHCVVPSVARQQGAHRGRRQRGRGRDEHQRDCV